MSESNKKWQLIQSYIREKFNMQPTIYNILFLIGVQEMGYGFTQLNQETKTKVFNFVSIYIMNYLSSEEKRMLSEPSGDEHKKEEIYKYAIIRYFNAKNIITNDR